MTLRPALLLFCLLFSFAASADQTQISNYSEARDLHWEELYTNGSWTLYCGEHFEDRSGLSVEHIYPASWMAAVLTKALGQDVHYNDVPPDIYRGFGFPGADDLGNMFQFKRDFEKEYCGARDLDVAQALNPSLQTFTKDVKQLSCCAG